MIEDIIKFILIVLAALGGGVAYGKKSEKKKQSDKIAKVLNENAKIDNKPDIDDPAARL